MSAITTVKGIPYQLGTDFSDPRSFRDLALAADAAFVAYDLAFTAGPRPPAFLVRASANSSAFGNGNGLAITTAVVEWNTSGGTINSSGTWNQDPNEVQSLWLFGLNIFTGVTSGTPTTGTPLEALFTVTSLDPVTGLVATTALGDGAAFPLPTFPASTSQVTYGSQTSETNTGAEFFMAHLIVPSYKAQVFVTFGNRDTGVQTKQSIAGTVFWGVRLGAV